METSRTHLSISTSPTSPNQALLNCTAVGQDDLLEPEISISEPIIARPCDPAYPFKEQGPILIMLIASGAPGASAEIAEMSDIS